MRAFLLVVGPQQLLGLIDRISKPAAALAFSHAALFLRLRGYFNMSSKSCGGLCSIWAISCA